MKNGAKIRIAKREDAGGMLHIYTPYIQNTSFTFETEVPTVETFADRIDTYLHDYPWLVCEIDDQVVGYAYGARYRERTAYQWSIESSVYIRDDFQRIGVAKALYSALIRLVTIQGFRNLYAVINLPNDRSVAFHERMGFEYFATYKKVGYKLGKWKNVGWWQLQINEYIMDPSPPLKFAVMDKQQINAILNELSH